MDKLENWITWGILIYLALRPQAPAVTSQQCQVDTTVTGWGVSDVLAQSGGLGCFGCNRNCASCQ